METITLKNNPLVVKISDMVTKISIYTLVFLIPLFFLPWTFDIVDFNKQALLIFLVFIALFSWIVKTLVTGSFKISLDKVTLSVGVLLLVYFSSFLFSVTRYGSFYGWPSPAYESIISIISFCLLYFLVSNTFSEKEIQYSFTILSISFLIAQIFGALQLFGVYILGFSFAKNMYFNTIGLTGALGLFCVTVLPLYIILLIISKKWWKVLFSVNIFVTFFVLLIINYSFLWWLVLLASVLMILFWIVRRDIFEVKWMFLPSFFLIVSLFFILFTPHFNQLPG